MAQDRATDFPSVSKNHEETMTEVKTGPETHYAKVASPEHLQYYSMDLW